MKKLNKLFFNQALSILRRLEHLLPEQIDEPNWQALAFRWKKQGQYNGVLSALPNPHTFPLTRLTAINSQMQQLIRNTEQFIYGRPANNVLLTGARGTGKSSLVKALLHEYATNGLRLIEVDKYDLQTLPALLNLLSNRPEKFIVFCDDLSFESNEDSYKALKTALDGSLSRRSENVLVYATSNRRHLMPEYIDENIGHSVRHEIQPQEAIEEKISLSDRFGLWLSFYPFDQEEYLQAARNWLEYFNVHWNDTTQRAALQWSQTRGNRSGRTAYQFACDWAGRLPEQRTI